MKNFALYFLFIIVLSIGLNACKDRHEYDVPEDFAIFVNRFEKEAAEHGKTFNFKTTGLIVQFAELDNNAAGICHYEKPIRIEIDKSYWNNLGRYANADLLREEIIFHELGHGFLNRKHNNELLSNDEWKSMMCGGDSVSGRTWNINYRGQRRKYYLDELFNQSTPEPAFTSYKLPIDTTGYTGFLSDDFSNAVTTIWELGSSSNSYSTIDDGMLLFQSKTTANLMVIAMIQQINVQSDFSLQFDLKYAGNNEKARFGLAFGTSSNNSGSESIDYVLINNKKNMVVGNNACFSYFTQVSRNQIISNGMNRLKIIKQGEMLYFFINHQYVYCSEIENKKDGYHFGFMVPAMETLYVDNFSIGKRSVSGVQPSKIKRKPGEKLNLEIKTMYINEISGKK